MVLPDNIQSRLDNLNPDQTARLVKMMIGLMDYSVVKNKDRKYFYQRIEECLTGVSIPEPQITA